MIGIKSIFSLFMYIDLIPIIVRLVKDIKVFTILFTFKYLNILYIVLQGLYYCSPCVTRISLLSPCVVKDIKVFKE